LLSKDASRFDPTRLSVCLCISRARTADYPLMAAACGFDAIYVDLEHGLADLDTVSMLCIVAAGAGLVPFVRLGRLDASLIARVLGGGAHGIIVSHIGSAQEAKQVVDAARFGPRGNRPVVGPNPVNRFTSAPIDAVLQDCDATTVVAVMIESNEALAAIDAIAATPGLDLLIVGAWDLSAALGVPNQFDHPDFAAALSQVSSACREHGKTLGLAGVSDLSLIATFMQQGVRFISAGTEWSLFMEAARHRTDALRTLSRSQEKPG
jgi:4-hydroxy-2-oxoheptanedioate aldolase